MKTHQFLIALLLITLIYFALLQAQEKTPADDVIRAKLFELVDDKGIVRASLKVEPEGETVLRLKDSKGEIRVKIGADESGSGFVFLNGKTEPGIHALANEKSTSITLTDKSGKKIEIKP